MGFKADACDLIFAVEAAIYDYVKRSNPESTLFPLAEGFGSSMVRSVKTYQPTTFPDARKTLAASAQ